MAGYVNVADIQQSQDGHRNLFFNGFKYFIKDESKTKTQWRCASQKCRASISTTNIDGVIMMKVLRSDHSHELSAMEEGTILKMAWLQSVMMQSTAEYNC